MPQRAKTWVAQERVAAPALIAGERALASMAPAGFNATATRIVAIHPIGIANSSSAIPLQMCRHPIAEIPIQNPNKTPKSHPQTRETRAPIARARKRPMVPPVIAKKIA
jgi:hypothetical protein